MAVLQTAVTRPMELVRSRRRLIATLLRRGVYFLLLTACLIGIAVSPGFRELNNFINVLQIVSYVGVIALGMTFVTLSGGFVDLSVSSIVSGAAVTVLLPHPFGFVGALVLALGVGVAVGAVNGFFVNVFRANPILLTLATNTVVGGVVLTATSGHYVYGTDPTLQAFGQASMGTVPVSVLLLLVLVAVAELVVRFTTWGQRLYAAGGNSLTALFVGLQPSRMRAQAFVLSGLGAALAGILLAASLNSASPTAGVGYDFNAIIAIVVGGASLNGGVGSPLGTLVGALLIGVLNNLLVLNGVAFPLQQVVTGAVLAVVVGLDVIARRYFD